MPFVWGLLAFVIVCSISFICRNNSYKCFSGAPQYSVPLSVSTLITGIMWFSKNGNALSFNISAAVTGTLAVYNFANPTAE